MELSGRKRKGKEYNAMKKNRNHSIRSALSMALIFALILTGFPGALTVSAQKGSSDSIGVLNDDTSGVYDRSTYRNGNKNSQLFNDGWKFAMFEDNAGGASFNDAAWQDVELPHDWMIQDADARSLFRRAHEYFGWVKTAWYRNTFYLPSGDEGKNISLRFDGIYMNTEIYVNGERINGISPHGYLPIQIDVSDKVKFGNTPNVIAIKINFGGPSSRWYSGSGIYRNAWLTVTDPVHVNPDGTYISTDGVDEVKIQTEVVNKAAYAANVTVVHNIIDAEDKVVQTIEGTSQNIASQEIVKDTQTTTISSPRLWDIDDPYVYRVETQIKSNGTVVDEYLSVFGFKTIEMDPDEGFYLNGRHIKLEGACMHHDLGALGAAVNYRALERQMEIMKDMGVNAIRLSHNAPTPELLEICDRMGLLVVNELHDTWNQGKIPNDHSRFFGKWHEQDTKTWVRRDRNHPSMIMWGIGNEIQETGSDQNTIKIAENLVRYIREEDPDKNAFTTIGTDLLRTSSSNPVNPNKPAQKISGEIVEAAGYNYNRGESFDSQHEAYPDMPIYGSETSSSTQSRGIYHFPPEINSTSSPDRQCSSYGNSVMLQYAHGIEDAWKWDRDRKFVLGSFIWTGFDYLGEPSPFGGNNTSFFGAVDTAGIPKDAFYFYKSVWGDEPVLHLFPYWDWNEGDTIPVWAYTNADSVELFKDGVSLGRQDFDLMGDVLHLEWDVVFHEGTNLKAVAYDEDGNVIATDQLSSFGDPVKVSMKPDRTTITADGRDLVFVEISVLDAKGVAVENARNIVEFKVSGAGKLVGVDNGDSVDFDSYEGPERKLFSGKAMAIIQSDGTGGEINITATSPGLESDTVTVSAVHKQKVSGIEVEGIDGISAIDENRGKLKINASVSPVNADYQKMNFAVTEEDGVTATDKAVIDKNGVLTAYKNGKVLVTASAADGSGASASMTVTITNQSAFTPVASLTVSGEDITTKSGTSQMSASINPNGAAVTDVKWTVENKSGSGAACASIDNGGLLKAHYDGEVTVRAAALDGSGVYGDRISP